MAMRPRPREQAGGGGVVSRETRPETSQDAARGFSRAGQGARPPAAADTETPNASPEEQARYERFVKNGLKLIYHDDGVEAVLQRLSRTEDPIDDLANTTVLIVRRLEDSAQKGGQPPGPDILLQGGAEIMSELADLAESAGITEFSEDDLKAASLRAGDLYMESGGLAVDEEAAAHDFQELMKAEQNGDLERMFPGVDQAFAGAPLGDRPRQGARKNPSNPDENPSNPGESRRPGPRGMRPQPEGGY